MAKQNSDAAREVMDALGRRDTPRLIELSDPEVEWHSFFAIGQEGGVYRGHHGTERYISDLGDAFDTARPDLDDTLSVGDLVVIVGRIHYRGRGSGVDDATPAGWVLKFREGRLLRFRAFRDPEGVLEAAAADT